MIKPSLLLTRPETQSHALAAQLDPRLLAGVEVVISPLLRIVPTGVVPDLGPDTGAIFTSARAVELAPPGQGRMAICVGERTARAAAASGWRIAETAETADALVAALQDRPGGALVHLAGKHRRGEIASRLTAAGWQVAEITLYDQEPAALTPQARALLTSEGPVIVPLYSPRSAALFAAQAGPARGITVVAISAAVIEALGDFRPDEVILADRPTGEDMCQGIEKALTRASLP
jgi:uroporphyrinogen-III synthase